jgi:cytochrome c6
MIAVPQAGSLQRVGMIPQCHANLAVQGYCVIIDMVSLKTLTDEGGRMKITMALVAALVFGSAAFAIAAEKSASPAPGEAQFKQHCMMCHPNGGNIVNPKKTLLKKDRDTNNIKTEADIVKAIRKPGPGMTAFDAKTLSEKDAHAIAAYILKTYR